MKSIHITRKQLLTGLALLSGLIVLIVCGTLWYLIATAPAPDPDTISLSPSESATYICDSNGNYMRRLTFATSNRDLVTLDEIPKALQQAVIAIEDERFYSHHGIACLFQRYYERLHFRGRQHDYATAHQESGFY